MKIPVLVLGVIVATSAASAGAQGTDFGVREVPGGGSSASVQATAAMPIAQAARGITSTSLASAVAIASRLGRVTSTRRSAAHNRRIGGVRNSFHLYGRAIDVVPRAGVRHADLEAALRNAGFHLIESLNEGDHSHFAFGTRPAYTPFRQAGPKRKEFTDWGLRLASR